MSQSGPTLRPAQTTAGIVTVASSAHATGRVQRHQREGEGSPRKPGSQFATARLLALGA